MQDRGSRRETYGLFARCLSNVVLRTAYLSFFSPFFLSSAAYPSLHGPRTWRVGVNAWEVLQGYEARSSRNDREVEYRLLF